MGDPQPRTLPWAVTSQGETRPLFPRLRPGECLGTRLSQELGDPLMLLFLWREQNIHVEEICTTHKKPKIGKKKTKKTQAWALLLLLWLMFRIAGITKNANNRGSGFNDFFDRNTMNVFLTLLVFRGCYVGCFVFLNNIGQIIPIFGVFSLLFYEVKSHLKKY